MGVTDRTPRRAYLGWKPVGLVALGGMAGTAARVALTLSVPSVGTFPAATFAINVVGAFLLGLLLDVLAKRDPDAGRSHSIRLLAGTGFLGGFTTYSALATDTVIRTNGDISTALAYSLGTLLAGGAATWAGIAVGARLSARAAAR